MPGVSWGVGPCSGMATLLAEMGHSNANTQPVKGLPASGFGRSPSGGNSGPGSPSARSGRETGRTRDTPKNAGGVTDTGDHSTLVLSPSSSRCSMECELTFTAVAKWGPVQWPRLSRIVAIPLVDAGRLRGPYAGSGLPVAVRRGKARIFSGCKSRPDNWSLHPVAIGAAVEATKPSKPSRQRATLGGSANRQAATRVNAMQAPKQGDVEADPVAIRGRPPSLETGGDHPS
jgi:hypothetical protein